MVNPQTLDRYWWHRLFKVVLWLTTSAVGLAVLATSVSGALEPQTSEVVTTRFANLMQSVRSDQVANGSVAAHVAAVELMGRFLSAEGYLGCAPTDGSLRHADVGTVELQRGGAFCVFADSADELGPQFRKQVLSPYRDFSDAELTARFGTGLVCVVPTSVCGGRAVEMVRLTTVNEGRQATETFRMLGVGLLVAVTLSAVWFWMLRLLYSRVFLYVLLGRIGGPGRGAP